MQPVARKTKIPKRTIFQFKGEIRLFFVQNTPPQPPVEEARTNSETRTERVRHPVIQIGAAVELRLDQFNEPAKGTGAEEHGQEANPPGACEREGQSRKGCEVHQLVAAIRRRRRRLHRPEHRDRECQGREEREGDVEELAHATSSTGDQGGRQVWADWERVRGKVESPLI